MALEMWVNASDSFNMAGVEERVGLRGGEHVGIMAVM